MTIDYSHLKNEIYRFLDETSKTKHTKLDFRLKFNQPDVSNLLLRFMVQLPATLTNLELTELCFYSTVNTVCLCKWTENF